MCFTKHLGCSSLEYQVSTPSAYVFWLLCVSRLNCGNPSPFQYVLSATNELCFSFRLPWVPYVSISYNSYTVLGQKYCTSLWNSTPTTSWVINVKNVYIFRMRFSASKHAPFGTSAGMFHLLKKHAWHFFPCSLITQNALGLDIYLDNIKVCTLIYLPIFDHLIKSVLEI